MKNKIFHTQICACGPKFAGYEKGMVIIMKISKWFLGILGLWVLFFIISMVVPPLHHKEVSEQRNAELKQDREADTFTSKHINGRIRSIDTNADALKWRLKLIENAKEKVILATFDFREDNSGRDIMAALLAAADRGVKVELLVDGINGQLYLGNSKLFWALASHENVEAHFYNPINFISPWVNNYRMHDKYLVADDFAFILGGRNTCDLFLGEYSKIHNEDRDILVYEDVKSQNLKKSVLSNLLEYYEEIRELKCCKKVKPPMGESDKVLNDKREFLRKHYKELCEKHPDLSAEINWKEETIAAESIELYSNPCFAKNKEPLLWARMIDAMKKGNDILVQTPYIICSKDMYKDLGNLVSDGKTVELMINAVEIGSNPFGCTDYLNQSKKIRNMGIGVYEYLGPHALHTKTVLVDDELSIVGTCNFDMRSVYLDTELMLFIKSGELNRQLREQIGELETASRYVNKASDVVMGAECTERNQSFSKKLFYKILQIVILPIRHLL